MSMNEEERIERLAEIFGAAGDAVVVGIGDDAAVLAPVAEPLVWTVDAAVEGTHFRREWLSFEDIGYRSTMAAASDLAAMGAEPRGVLSALVLPDDVGDAELEALARGQREAADAIGTVVIGGNLARGRELSITTTVLGHVPRPILRRGARPGDALWLVGPVGLAAAGWRLLAGGCSFEDAAARACVDVWRRPRARIASGLAMRASATAAADVSDGLARDVAHVARASGARAVIALPLLDTATLSIVAARLGVPALDLALFGGEDYALVLAAPEDARVPEDAVRIGWFEATGGAGDVDPVVACRADGSRFPLKAGGYDHFAR